MFAGHTQQFVTAGAAVATGRHAGRVWRGDSCLKKRNSFAGTLLELHRLQFPHLKPFSAVREKKRFNQMVKRGSTGRPRDDPGVAQQEARHDD